MKKTILAMAVPALMVAGAANAGVDIYDADGVNVNVGGAMEVQYRKTNDDKADDKSKGQFRIDDGDLAIKTEVEISDSLKAMGSMEFKYDSKDATQAGSEAVLNDRLYVGLGGDFGTVTVGRQTTIADDVGVGKDIEFGGTKAGLPTTDGNQVLKYTVDMDTVYGGVSYWADEDGSAADDNKQTVGKIGVRFEGVDARAYFGKEESKTKTETDLMGVEAEYSIEGIGLAVGYLKTKEKTGAGVKTEASSIQAAADYTLNDTTFSVGYTGYEKEKAEEKAIYASVAHQLHSKVKVYGEVQNTDKKGDDGKDVDTQLGFAAGLEVKF